MKIKSALFAVALATMLLAPTISHASNVTEIYTFSINLSAGAPVAQWNGSFTITYDPTIFDVTGSLDAFSSNLPSSYDTFVWLNQTGLGLIIGDNCNALGCAATGPHEAFLIIATTNVDLYDGTASYFSTSGKISSVAAAPELSTWAMMLVGFAGIGFMAHRRRRSAMLAA